MHQPSCAPAPRPAGPAPPACTSRPARRRLALPGLPRGDLRRPDDRSLNPPPPPVRAVASRLRYSSALLRRPHKTWKTPRRTPRARLDPLARATPAPQTPPRSWPFAVPRQGAAPAPSTHGRRPGPGRRRAHSRALPAFLASTRTCPAAAAAAAQLGRSLGEATPAADRPNRGGERASEPEGGRRGGAGKGEGEEEDE